MVEIKVNCEGSHYLALNKLKILQDDDDFQLKELTTEGFEKLKGSLEEEGFWFPFFFWYCKKEGINYYLDGTQRDKVLNWMLKKPSEFKLPEKYPCAQIYAKNKKHAAKAILYQSSNHGKIDDEKLHWYLNRFNLIPQYDAISNRTDLPGIDSTMFRNGYIDNSFPEGEIKEYDENIETNMECPKCGYEYYLTDMSEKRRSHERAVKLTDQINECQLSNIDGCKGILDRAHKDGNHFNNDPDNVIVLCRSHHSLFDKGKIDLNDPAMPEYYTDSGGKRRYEKTDSH